jgi:3-oxoacyl-[acyl-carrier protein] reductase
MDVSFQATIVIVTGGSRGIGRAIALAFAENGADVAVCSRGIESLKAVEQELRARSGNVFAAACDVVDEAALAGFISQAAIALGSVNVLINNASGLGLSDDESAWQSGIIH